LAGIESLKVFIRGASGLRDCLMSDTAGGTILSKGLSELVAEGYPDAPPVETAFEVCDGVASFRRALERDFNGQTLAPRFAPNIVTLSLEADLRGSSGEWGPAEVDRFEDDLLAVVRLIKADLGSHVIVVNASSIDPASNVTGFQDASHEPLALRAHRYNLATMHVSYEEGISIVDADRLVAELGAAEVVQSFLEYTEPGARAICAELARVIGDYGFLDNRPVLPQMGRS